nr:MAG TPA: D12 class N6 adenine-specific DNA methyltransferase [Caudoviricetes sp.]
MKYGLPYKGSKNKLAERIVRLLPKRTHLVDLFCGGCAVSHAALLMGKYEHIHINDINWMCPTLFIDALNGKYNDENRWISREDFFRLKDTDPYVAVVWSFGNNLRDYLYSKEIEPLKKAIHYAMFFSDYSLGKELGHDLSFIDPIHDLQKRYLAVKHYFNKLGHFQQQSFEGRISECSLSKPWNDSTPICGIGGQKRLAEIGDNGKTYKRPSELQHLECINRVSQFKKKNRSGELCNCERRNTVASLAISRTAAQSAQIFGGAVSTYHVLCA